MRPGPASHRSLLAVPLTALLLALAAMVAPAAQAQLLFSPCTEKGQEGFECANLRVPIDRGGKVPGTVVLRVERLIQAVQPARTLVNIEGGPGGSATWRSQQSARLFAPLRDRYQLVVVDPRGIGKSRPYLRCSPDPAKCAKQLGGSARFYTTADNVADIESVRAELGAEQLFLYGTSYGTYVAQQYARTHPERTERVVLDSPVPPDGIDPLQRATFASVEPMLRRLCADGACAGITTDIVRDVRRLARALQARPRNARVFAASGRSRAVWVDEGVLFGALMQGDENVTTRALVPGAVRAGLRGDLQPLARLAALGADHYTARQLNEDIYVPTSCSDMRLPWRRSDGPAARRKALVRSIDALRPADLGPFSRQLVGSSSVGSTCLDWPDTSLARAITNRPPAPAPTLVLQGLGDLRTSPIDARNVVAAIPGAQVMEVPFRAHGVLRTTLACGQQALEAFVADRPVGNPCAATQPLLAVQPTPPRDRSAVRGGSPAVAQQTVADALAIAQVLAPNGGSVRGSGLRGGTLRGSRLAGDRSVDAAVRLHRYAYVPGTRVTGTVKLRAGRVSGTVKVTTGGKTRSVVLGGA